MGHVNSDFILFIVLFFISFNVLPFANSIFTSLVYNFFNHAIVFNHIPNMFYAGPSSTILAEHWTNTGSMSCFNWDVSLVCIITIIMCTLL